MSSFKQFNESINESLDEAAFSTKNLKKVSDLLAKIGSKKLGAKFQFAWFDKFKKAGGVSGTGARYMSTAGQQIRFNHSMKSKNTFVITSVDYWKKGAGFTDPTLTLTFAEGVNIVNLKEELFQAIKTGKVPKISKSLLEASSAEKKNIRRIQFAKKHSLDPKGVDNNWVANSHLKRVAGEAGLGDEYDEWMSVKKHVSETTEFDKKIKADEKLLGPNGVFADPSYVFKDMEQAALTVAKKKWRSMIVAGQGGIGKCVSGETEAVFYGLPI